MGTTTLMLAVVAIVLLVIAFWRGRDLPLAGLWALWPVTRLPVEMALIAPKPALVRYAVTFVVPPIAGLVAEAVARML